MAVGLVLCPYGGRAGSDVSDQQRETLVVQLDGFVGARTSERNFSIEKSEVQRLMAEHNLTLEQLLRALVQPASKLARPPISNFYVG